jgi:hypothetical protein
LLESVTVNVPVAFLFNVTEQEADPPEATLAGQLTELSETGAVSARTKVRVTPLAVAVIVAETSAATAAAVAVKLAVVAAAATVTEAGAVTLALLLDSETTMPPASAGKLNVTVQFDVAGPCTEAGVQERLLNWGSAETITESVTVTPPAAAVTVTV